MTLTSCLASSRLLNAQADCVDADCVVRVVEDRYSQSVYVGEEKVGDLSDNGYLNLNTWEKPAPELLDSVCEADISGSEKLLAFYNEWDPRDTRLSIEAASDKNTRKLQAIQADYLSCEDVVYVSEDGAIASYSVTRSYCSLSTPILPCGPAYTISPILFAGFVFSNPNSETFPYIVAYIATFLVLVVGLMFLSRRGHLGLFLRPTKVHTIALAIGFPILFCLGMVLIPYLTYALVGYYLLVCTVSYLITSRGRTA